MNKIKMTEGLYLFYNLQEPVYRQWDQKYHVRYMRDDKWYEETFLTQVEAWLFYNHIQLQLRNEFMRQKINSRTK